MMIRITPESGRVRAKAARPKLSSRAKTRGDDPVTHLRHRSASSRMFPSITSLLIVTAAMLACVTQPSFAAQRGGAQPYPNKSIRLLVPFTPGGSQDVTARLVSASVQQALGENIVVDNRPGSGGLIATQEGARATPDGYTLVLSTGAQMAIAPALHANAGYDPMKSFVHIIHLTDTPLALVVHPGVPANTVKEFIAYTHANKGKVNVASTGNGTYTHLTIELFKSLHERPAEPPDSCALYIDRIRPASHFSGPPQGACRDLDQTLGRDA
jgi:hypothetical protein